jgi:hypothetical protein
MASAAVMAGSVLSTGGLTVLGVKVFRSKKKAQTESSNTETESTTEIEREGSIEHGDDQH